VLESCTFLRLHGAGIENEYTRLGRSGLTVSRIGLIVIRLANHATLTIKLGQIDMRGHRQVVTALRTALGSTQKRPGHAGRAAAVSAEYCYHVDGIPLSPRTTRHPVLTFLRFGHVTAGL
ncbi:hypothetical protein, partial [Cryobacterium lactosi]|uniref:hypothetical protein n=1 Tax=Cryobacterium lactosi TaxID=1259202 RepID=UPI001A7E95D5